MGEAVAVVVLRPVGVLGLGASPFIEGRAHQPGAALFRIRAAVSLIALAQGGVCLFYPPLPVVGLNLGTGLHVVVVGVAEPARKTVAEGVLKVRRGGSTWARIAAQRDSDSTEPTHTRTNSGDTAPEPSWAARTASRRESLSISFGVIAAPVGSPGET